METMHAAGPADPQSDKSFVAPAMGHRKVVAIRIFVAVCAVAIAIETLPSSWLAIRPAKNWLNMKLGYLGLSQGDWPLFAPNPVLKNGMISAEVSDSKHQQAMWNSPDWARSSSWQKFYRFRHMNYFQRVGKNRLALSDLADYLHLAIPGREPARPSVRWSESNEILPPAQLVPPILFVKLYQHRQSMVLIDKAPLPKQSDTTWSNQSSFLLRREYSP
jgi:hypothetical protein